MADFNGKVYVIIYTRGSTQYAIVRGLVDRGCRIWDDVTPQWSVDGLPEVLVFQNKLYVRPGSQLWEFDGSTWRNVTASYPSWGILAGFKGQLIVDASGIRGTDGKLRSIESWEIFQGRAPQPYLYAGVGLYPGNGIELWRTADGKTWVKFQEVKGPTAPAHVHALRAFKGYLYLGEYHGEGLYRTDGTAASWQYIPNAIKRGGDVFRLEEHKGQFYLGIMDFFATSIAPGDPLLYSSSNGTQWSAVLGTNAPKVDTNRNIRGATSLLSKGGELYVGTLDFSGGGVSLYVLGSPASCQVASFPRHLPPDKLPKWIDTIREYFPYLPPLEVMPPPGPIPPVVEEWEFVLLADIIRALAEVGVPPELEELRFQALEILQAAYEEVWIGMTMLFDAMAAAREELQEAEQPELLDEVIGHLELALELCNEAAELLAAAAPEGVLLFRDDFEDGVADGWELEPGWQIEQEDGNYVLSGEGHSWARLTTGQDWTDYALRLRLRLFGGVIHINYRVSDDAGRYFIGFRERGLYLAKEAPWGSLFTLAESDVFHGLGEWHDVEIVGRGGHLQVYVDGVLEIDFTDSEAPLLQGSIAFETLEGSYAQVDDVEVLR